MKFNAKEVGYDIYVQVPATFEEDKESSEDSILYATVRAFHTGSNKNRSNLTEKAAKECMKNMAYKPVLANFCEIDGVRDFTAHDMEINDDGSIDYIEKQVGCFTADKPYFEQDPNVQDRKYIMARIAIPRDYTDAADIIERKGGTKVSVELQIFDMSYDSTNKELLLNSANVTGLTLLGRDPLTGDEIQAGMYDAEINLNDFSAENNSFVFNKQDLIEEISAEIMSRIDYKLANNSPYNYKEGGRVDIMDNENVNMNVEFNETETEETEVKTEVEEVEVEATEEEDTPVVETEASKEEVTDEATPETPDEVVDNTEVVEEFDGDDQAGDDSGDDSGDDTDDEESEEEHQSVSAIEDEDSTEARINNSLNYSVTINGVTKEFAVSLKDKINAVAILVNDTYSESDNAFYDVDVYEEPTKYCVMHDWWNDRHFKQEYTVKKDVYSLKGDRIKVTMQFLTDDQIAQLDKMKSDFAAIESELNSYKEKELHSQREAILASEDYSVMADFEEFNNLKSNMDNYSVDDLAKEADLVYAKYMKSNYSNFAAASKDQQKPKHNVVFMTSGENKEEERLPYGGLFKNFKGKK